jgi:hypothetical protein
MCILAPDDRMEKYKHFSSPKHSVPSLSLDFFLNYYQYVVVFLKRNPSKSVFGAEIQEAWVLSLAWSQMH